jgi:Glycoside hydrolase family 44
MGLERAFAFVAALALVSGEACRRPSQGSPDASQAAPLAADDGAAAATPRQFELAELMFDSGLTGGWQDWGWSPREVGPGHPARVRFDNWGGWTLAKPDLAGRYGGIVFRVKAPPGAAEFLQVGVEAQGVTFPRVNVTANHHRDAGDGWSEVFVPMSELDPDDLPFDRFTFRTFRLTSSDWVYIDHVALTKAAADAHQVSLEQVALSVDCSAKATAIAPTIYGINYYPHYTPERQAAQWRLGATARRWGGNTMSTFNWEINAWNTGEDWFYENVGMPSYVEFLKDDATHAMDSAVTVPMTGWVAKDSTSFSFPVSVFGKQDATDAEFRPDAGNGKTRSGKLIPPGPPTRAYVQVTPAFVKKWIGAIREDDAKTGKRSVQMYILDNEPALWNFKHRDVHPDPVTYDELLDRTIAYGTAIREADPDALVAGPAEWGWYGYLYSAKDMAAGAAHKPDRRAHGDVALVEYYLKALAEREAKTGARILDVFDLHAYPQGKDVYSDKVDPETAALRIRQTRMLWDGTYVDESYIKDRIKLLPRMRQWVDENYPGRALSIGEWNFGGEDHMSGGLAAAEALGRFGQFGVTWAFYWAYPPENSPAMWAFRAYRDYDGKGGHFLEWSQPTTSASPGVSLFASRDDSGAHMVLVALNLSPEKAASAHLDVGSCGKVASETVYSYTGGPAGFVPEAHGRDTDSSIVQTLPPYSMTVIDLRLADARSVAK